jgi:predicted TIM-barrel enzyme
MRELIIAGVLVGVVVVGTAASITHRSRTAVEQFKRQSGYPHGRVGYVVDHVVPLCAGGPDTPENMQWQELDASKAKDRFEDALCAAMKREGLVLVRRLGVHP